MKRFLLILLCVVLSISTICLVACNNDSTNTTTDEGSSDVTHYTVTFETDSNVSVYVYNTDDMSGSGTLSTTAVARDSDTGQVLIDGNGQVNFKLVFADGYTIGSITADKNCKNIKDPSDTGYTNGYRITKITGDVTVTITSAEEDSDDSSTDDEDGDATSYTVTFVTDSNVSVYVYNTDDMSGSGTLATTAVARDSDTGDISVDGTGQVNFKLVFSDGYMIKSITADKNYKNLKDPSETECTNGYRITKITGDVTVTITSMEEVDGFTVTFNYDTSIDGLGIIVYESQDYTTGASATYSSDTTFYARTDEGVITTNASDKPQVNFKVVLPDGYVVDTITATDGLYNNIKLPAETEADNTYRVTKITGDIEITVTVKKATEATGFVITIGDAEYDASASLTITYGSNWESKITGYLTFADDSKSEVEVEYSDEPTAVGTYEISVSYGTYSAITLNLTIEKKTIAIPTNNFDTLFYTGEELEFYPENYDDCLMSISGNIGTNRATYKATVSLLDSENYSWEDETIEGKEYIWYISSNIVLKIPTANGNTFTYNGEEQTYTPNGFNSTYMTISNNVQKEIGEYEVVVALKDINNFSWVDGTTKDQTYTFTISKTLLDKASNSGVTYSYTGSKLTYIPAGFDEDLMSITGNTATNVGTYTAVVTLKDSDNYAWSNNSTESLNISWEIEKATLVKPKTTVTSLTYTGSILTFTPSGYSATTMNISGNTGTNVGTYTAVISIKDSTNYEWADETSADIEIEWTIEESSLNYTVKTVDSNTVTVSHTENTTDYFATFTMPTYATYSINQDTGLFTISFAEVATNNVEFTVTGTFYGALQFNVNEEDNCVLNLSGFTLTSTLDCPINIVTANNFDISANKGTTNYIYDKRDETEDLAAAIYSTCDLKLKGTGSLTIESDNNNGIHTKDDLEIQKLTLSVNSVDNALKGNDSVTIHSGTITLISRQGDGIKTSNSGLYSSSSNQQGTIIIEDGTINIYAACDGIDATYNVSITGGTLNIYTDKYSEYSEEVTTVTSGTYYIKSKTSSYKYSIYYYNSSSDYMWVNSSSYTTQSSMGRTYYYYELDKPSGYSYLKVYVYSSSQSQGQSSSYSTCSSALTINDNYDTIYYNESSFSWTNYTTSSSSGMGGPGGQGGMMEEGNTDKGEYSTKGIKADNEINISGGTINIKSYDDALHTNNDVTLESGNATTGNINITGGTLTLYSNDDGIHGDGKVTISGDNTVVSITNSYEGIEGAVVEFAGGSVKVVSSDDGVNGTNTSGESIIVSGGYLYIYAGGDGLDSNSKTSYDGMLISGGHTVVISCGQSDSSLDTESGYKYTGGYVVGIGLSGGMSSEATNASNFSSIGKSTTMSLTQNYYLTVSGIVSIKMPKTMSSLIVVLGSTSASISTSSTSSLTFDGNVSWIAD